MRPTWKNVPHLETAPHLQKFATLGKCAKPKQMRQPSKNALHLEKYARLGKWRHTWKTAPHLEKCATPAKISHP